MTQTHETDFPLNRQSALAPTVSKHQKKM
ncbi:uncharacterized protein METZ01_LOCUS426202 [marine metagenome]|uniref:Uncharacterized protein n=1 Tax=marine metagenome TaxID=408172 RepID=A0A382XSU7_9ZZZZ